MAAGLSQDEKNRNSAFRSLDTLFGRIKDGTFGEILDDWKWIFSYSVKYKGAIAFYTLLGVVGTSLGLISSIASKYLIDIITGYKTDQLSLMLAVMVGSAVFSLTPAEPESVRERMKELKGKRSASQPLDLPSAGSAFKRPVGGYAAALIDQAGLKGFRVGGAAISEKHAGFAVNLGGATAEDVCELLRQVSDRVFANSGIRLEPEVRIW